MENLLNSPADLWLAFGVMLIAIEAFTVPGIGLFLGGIAAIVVGILAKIGLVSEGATLAQFAWFFGLTVALTAAFWKPLKHFRTQNRNRKALQLNNMIGETGIVGKDGLKQGYTGQVMWSGTWMSAEIDSSIAASTLPEGALVTIVAVSGNTLKVTPKLLS